MGWTLLVPLLCAVLLSLWQGWTDIGAALLGALGWLVALALRVPVAAGAIRLRDQRNELTVLGAVSGPADEVARLGLVLVGVAGPSGALWAGFGWALAEQVFTMISAVSQAAQLGRPGVKGRRASELLFLYGGLAGARPWHRVIERVAAFAFHLGATLLLATQPWWVLLTAPVHAGWNLARVRWSRRHLVRVELVAVVTGGAVLLAGLLVAGLFR
ncbi:MAG TPA: hypothetical protein VIL00_03605 [Pseudonocardiaceae bacterium]